VPDVQYHGWTHRPKRIGGSDPLRPLGYYEIKVFADENALDGNLPDSATVVVVGDEKFVWPIPIDLHKTEIIHAAGGVSTLGEVTFEVVNLTQAVTLATVTIDSGEYTSYFGTDPEPTLPADAPVEMGDRIAINVTAADGSAKGLTAIVQFAGL
jgi:hypothetical protein